MITQEEAKRIDEFEKWPEIGSRAGAVKSCVSLLSAVCGQPDDVMERWLDLYYQVRHAQEKADAAARAAERLKEMAQLDAVLEPFQAAEERVAPSQALRASSPQGASQESAEDGGKMAPASAAKDEAEDAGRPLSVTAASGGDSSPQGASQESAEDAEPSQSAAPTALPGGASQGPVKRPGGKGTPRPSQLGNTRSRDAAEFKRQVRDRLAAVRKKGVSAPEIVRAAPTAGAFTANNIYEILEGKVLRIEIYRALDEALRHFEN